VVKTNAYSATTGDIDASITKTYVSVSSYTGTEAGEEQVASTYTFIAGTTGTTMPAATTSSIKTPAYSLIQPLSQMTRRCSRRPSIRAIRQRRRHRNRR